MSACTPWTTAELRLLRMHYPRGGSAACAQALPNRSQGAIQRRARRETRGLPAHWREAA